MTITKTQNNGKLIFTLEGRLDTSTSPKLQEELMTVFDEAKEVVLDFTNLAYISSAGLRVLLMGQKTANLKESVMTLTGVSEAIMEVFDMTGFTDILSFDMSTRARSWAHRLWRCTCS